MPPPLQSADQIQDWLVNRIADMTQVPPDDIDPDAPFNSLNLESTDVVSLTVDLEQVLGIEIESTIPWDYPTAHLLSNYLATQLTAA